MEKIQRAPAAAVRVDAIDAEAVLLDVAIVALDEDVAPCVLVLLMLPGAGVLDVVPVDARELAAAVELRDVLGVHGGGSRDAERSECEDLSGAHHRDLIGLIN